jgi:uncharacterized protein (DUF1800 family)
MLPTLSPKVWSRDHASHLLNRAGFGGAPDEIDALHKLGFPGAVRSLLAANDQAAGFAAPEWAKPRDMQALRREARQRSGGNEEMMKMEFQKYQREERAWVSDLQNWWLQRMLKTPAPLLEKTTLFWHGHFATSSEKVRSAYLLRLQNETLRKGAFGSFNSLVKAISRDPAMIVWLDLRQSRSKAPNENFARELMELFTLGEGHYTEQDIKEAARAFTGYRIAPETQSYQFFARDHDTSEKSVFGKKGPFGGDDIIDMILANPQCARYMSRKIWEFFVYEEPDPKLVEVLAQGWMKSGYNTGLLLKAIFESAEFYSEKAICTQIKSPVQWIVQSSRQLGLDGVPTVAAFHAMRELGQVLFRPPNVKGWDGGKAWITTASLFSRYNIAGQIVGSAAAPGGRERLMKFAEANGLQPFEPTLDIASLAPESVRDDPAKVAEMLAIRFFGVTLPGKELTPFIEFAAGKFPLDDRAITALAHLMMSTPRFQLC